MKTENTSIRLKKIMKDRHLRQVDILEATKPYCEKYNVKLNKSDLSQYVSGLVEPGQDKLSLLGMALGVSEAWLMGYDVPMLNQDYVLQVDGHSIVAEQSVPYKTDTQLFKLLTAYQKLNSNGKLEAVNRVTELTYVPQYVNANIEKLEKPKKKYIPTEDDINSLVARNGRKMTREEAFEFISDLLTDDDDEENE